MDSLRLWDGDIPEIERAWAAGLFDGEGSWVTQKNGNLKYFRMVLGNTNLEVLHRLQKVVGGKIYYHKKNNPKDKWKRKQFYTLQTTNRRDTNRALIMLLPYLSNEKKNQLSAVLGEVLESEKLRKHKSRYG